MIKLSENANFKIFKNVKNYNYFPKTFEELFYQLKRKAYNQKNDLNDINVSMLDKIGGFQNFRFFKNNNFFVEDWNVSRVKDFGNCFANCFCFDSELSDWDVSNGVNFFKMFSNCLFFNRPILNFDVSNGVDFGSMFFSANCFNQELYNFKFGIKSYSIKSMFSTAFNFNRDISMWDVSNIKIMSECFYFASSFKQNLSNWNVENVVDFVRFSTLSPLDSVEEFLPKKFRSR